MAKTKTYWDEIKHQETFFHGGKQGWEVHLRRIEYRPWDPKTKSNSSKTAIKMEFQWPFRPGDGVSREEKSRTRKEVLFEYKKHKIIAQASANKEEFRDLMNRISRISEEEFNKLIDSGLKGFPLRKYITEQYLTDSEAHALFWRM